MNYYSRLIMEEKITKKDPGLKGLYFEVNDTWTELKFPPSSELIVSIDDITDNFRSMAEESGCEGQVEITEEGNKTYAWFYIQNNSNKDANVSIEKIWMYNGNRKRQTARLRLYAGEKRNIFNMPRNQKPTCGIIVCLLDG